MNMKRITLMAFLLLAVLAIGAVSASDDIASDGLNASDDTDITVIEDYDEYEHSIEVNDEICLDEEDEDYDGEVAYITLPDSTTKGSFQIRNDEVVVAHTEIDLDDDDHWELYDEEGILYGTLYLDDLDITKVNDGDVLTFEFLENDGNPVDFFTKEYTVKLTASTMKLLEIGGGMTEDDVDIQVNNIDTTKPDENFTYVYVAQKGGIFIITVEGDDEDLVILQENLNTTKRPYVTIEIDGEQFYKFGFSFADVNNYIAQNIAGVSTFNDLVNMSIISSGNEMYFEIYEDESEVDEGDALYDETMIFRLEDGGILFKGDEEDVDVEYGNMDVIMYDGWQENDLITSPSEKVLAARL